jgi:hypothetical protein
MPTLGVAMNSGERINYLSLALQARSAIKRLSELRPIDKPTSELKSTLQAALSSLGAAGMGESLCNRLYEEGGFNRFEEIHTLEEVIRTLNNANPQQEIGRIVSGEFADDDIRAAIRFFSAVENRALYHYDDPSLAESFR